MRKIQPKFFVILGIIIFSQYLSLDKLLVYSQTHKKDYGFYKKRWEEVISQLNLTPEQKDKISKLREDRQRALRELREQFRNKRTQLKEELDKDSIDKVKVERIVSDIKDLMGKMLDKRIEEIIAIRNILSLEQFRLLNERMEGFYDLDREKGFKGGKLR
ncbi:MAG: Spy/CpxP family protein refolding chaperone [Candidatus Omnitrophica bacterium]|nr:Spy/CpxP family protein refolding chaperone [Candidatus Omnitrophota bacterium]MCM8823708.1 Spy/CpxP family protein refolding chaperone [Candidatus Omnitrophota bacterium]MCM8827120.1 Spy/CpxP family protein refolding chaperone [Candidatus Omnitrophota bacterium]